MLSAKITLTLHSYSYSSKTPTKTILSIKKEVLSPVEGKCFIPIKMILKRKKLKLMFLV